MLLHGNTAVPQSLPSNIYYIYVIVITWLVPYLILLLHKHHGSIIVMACGVSSNGHSTSPASQRVIHVDTGDVWNVGKQAR